jgi:hypothetical protein
MHISLTPELEAIIKEKSVPVCTTMPAKLSVKH